MNLLHVFVEHSVFGTGEITQHTGEMITIEFPKPHGRKRFLYPSAFSQHLTLNDATLIPELETELRSYNTEIAAAQNRVDRAERIARFRADSTAKAKKPPRARAKKT